MITCNRKDLLAVAERCSRVCNERSTIPIYSCMRLELAGEELLYRATDVTHALAGSLPAKGKPFAFCVNARELVLLLGALEGDEVKIEEGKGFSVKLTADGKRAVRVQTVPVDEYPEPIEYPADYPEIPAEPLRRALERTMYSVGGENDRDSTKIVNVEANGALKVVTLDGHRLSSVSVDYQGPDFKFEIPRRAASYISDTEAETIGIVELGPRLFVRVGSEVFACQMIGAKFPPYENIIETHEHSVEIDVEPLRSVLSVIRKLGPDMAAELQLGTDGIVIRSERSGEEPKDFTDEIPVGCPHELTIRATSRYLEEALAHCPTERVTLNYSSKIDRTFKEPLEAVNFIAPGYHAMVMQRRK